MTFLKYDKKYKIERILYDDGFRPVLENPYYVDGVLKATNGHALVHVKVDNIASNLPEGPIPKELFIRARKNAHKDDVVTLNQNDSGMIRFGGERLWFERDEAGKFGKYPNTEQVIPRSELGPTKLAINPTLLLKLAEAMGSPENVVLHISNNTKKYGGDGVGEPIYVEVTSDPNVEGVIMPMVVDTSKLRKSVEKAAVPVEVATSTPTKEDIEI